MGEVFGAGPRDYVAVDARYDQPGLERPGQIADPDVLITARRRA